MCTGGCGRTDSLACFTSSRAYYPCAPDSVITDTDLTVRLKLHNSAAAVHMSAEVDVSPSWHMLRCFAFECTSAVGECGIFRGKWRRLVYLNLQSSKLIMARRVLVAYLHPIQSLDTAVLMVRLRCWQRQHNNAAIACAPSPNLTSKASQRRVSRLCLPGIALIRCKPAHDSHAMKP